MNIKIRSITNPGDGQRERLVLKVLADDDIGRYAVFQATSDGESIYAFDVENAFWFPDKPVAAGDLVVLYTKRGAPREKAQKNGRTNHFFYWGIGGTIWHHGSYAPVLVEIKNWESHQPD